MTCIPFPQSATMPPHTLDTTPFQGCRSVSAVKRLSASDFSVLKAFSVTGAPDGLAVDSSGNLLVRVLIACLPEGAPGAPEDPPESPPLVLPRSAQQSYVRFM